MVIECLLFASHYSKCYLYTDSFNTHNNTKSYITIIGHYNYFYFTNEKNKFQRDYICVRSHN